MWQRCHSKMTVSRHLGYYKTGNSAIQSANPETVSLEPNMEWIAEIGCTVCEIFAFKLYFDLKTGDARFCSRCLRRLICNGKTRAKIVCPQNTRMLWDMHATSQWMRQLRVKVWAYEFWVLRIVRGHSRSSKVAPFDRAHTTLYSSSIVTMPLSLTVSEI